MRIMYVINSFEAGGAELHLLAVARNMISFGHSVLVVGLTGAVFGGARNIEGDFLSVGAQTKKLDYFLAPWLRDIGRWFALRKLANIWAPDIVHSHLPRSDFAASFVKRAMPDTIWICTVHDAYIKGVYAGYWIFRWTRRNWRRADRIIAVSAHAQRWVLTHLKIPKSKTSIIYHGVAPVTEALQSREVISCSQERPFLVGSLARFEPRKGISTLIKAVGHIHEKYPNVHLVIAGSDPIGYADKMRELSKKLNVSHSVKLESFCNSPYEFLRKLDIFAFASVSEGFGIVLLQAMLTGLPIVASDIYPINHIVVNGETGILVNPSDPQAFAAAIRELLESPEVAKRMGDAGKRRCITEFSEGQMIASIVEIYHDLIGF